MLKHLELSKASMGVNVVPSRLLWTLERCQGKSWRHSGKCAIQVRSPEEERSECSTVLSSNRRQPLYHLVPFIVHLLASAFAQSPESYGRAGESWQTGCAFEVQRLSLLLQEYAVHHDMSPT